MKDNSTNVKGHPAASESGISGDGGSGLDAPSCSASSLLDEFRSNGWTLNIVESTLSEDQKDAQRKSFKSQPNYHPNDLLILDESDVPHDQRDLVRFLRA